MTEQFEHLEARLDTAARNLPQPGRPHWAPLEALLGPALVAQFMFMGQIGAIRQYKHGMTRGYLNLSPDLRCWRYDSQYDGQFRPTTLAAALAHVFADVERLGGAPGVAYDATYRAERDSMLAQAGFRSLTLAPGRGVVEGGR